MVNVTGAYGESGDLFGKRPVLRHDPVLIRKTPPELKAARVLCRQLRRKQSPQEKKRIAHLICLNLLTLLKRES
jgi:hypothetical protein